MKELEFVMPDLEEQIPEPREFADRDEQDAFRPVWTHADLLELYSNSRWTLLLQKLEILYLSEGDRGCGSRFATDKYLRR